jgi:GT2 family glycosyltransferase
MKDLTIIIVTFNSSLVIKSCLEKINFEKYQVVVVDNASADNTVEIVSKNFSQAKIIKSEKNIGYGRGNNLALREVKTEFSLILNPDAFIYEKDIENALEILKKDEKIALASTKIFNNEEAFQNYKNSEKEFSETHFIVGGVMFMRSSIFQKIGFFDEDYFMFAEDNELSDRAIENGFKNIIINSSKAFHIGGASSKKSAKNTYRRFWHLGWSKSKYKSKRKGKLNFIRATSRLVLIYFFESIFYALIGNFNKAAGKIGFSYGCFSYLVGIKAFKKDGSPMV